MDLRGGVLRVQYEGGTEDELIRLTHAGVSVSGFDTHHKGEQNLTLQYLGQPVNANFVSDCHWPKMKQVRKLFWELK
ncbi:endo-beta-N-acetylglucosaminidase [Streptococcus pneumoniae]|nr:endo-beta-N-acetylglucosaminidase [Streptococcus pneumoniae]